MDTGSCWTCLLYILSINIIPSTGLTEKQLPGIYIVTPNNGTSCPETEENVPANRVNSTQQLADLRAVMVNTKLTGGYSLDAYFVFSGDQHMTTTAHDARVEFMSGFSGAGYLVITKEKAALWTDGRYYLQADMQMDCNWILMEQTPGFPTANEWIADTVPEGGYVGVDPLHIAHTTWTDYKHYLTKQGLHTVEVPSELVSYVWTEGRPAPISNPVYEHTLHFAGVSWQDKLKQVHDEIENTADVLIVTELDETAWLFNLRGSDKQKSPLFDSYAIVTNDSIRLLLTDYLDKLSDTKLQQHLNTSPLGTCPEQNATEPVCIEVGDYTGAIEEMTALSNKPGINKIWITPYSNYAVFSSIGDKRLVRMSPIQVMKVIKNDVEIKRYRECQIRDSLVVVEFAAFMENEISQGKKWTELSAGDMITSMRSKALHNRGTSFTTISAVGSNAAIVHYRPTNDTDRPLSEDEVYMLDSGGQYLDGTTDVTRTFHYGVPSDTIKEAYTRVLMGAIDLATTVWPAGLEGGDIDVRARSPLWEHGMHYDHGTGHGIGFFLNVHEGPAYIRVGKHSAPLSPGMFFSDEPGYYLAQQFGIRLETIVQVVKAIVPNTESGRDYLTLDPVTFVPFEPNLIAYELLNQKHRQWLNTYNTLCTQHIGPLVRDNKLAHDWLMKRVVTIPDQPTWSTDNGTTEAKTLTYYTLLATIALFFFFHL